MEQRVIDEIRKEIGCGDTLNDDQISKIFSDTFTKSRIALGFAIKDASNAIRKNLPSWLVRR